MDDKNLKEQYQKNFGHWDTKMDFLLKEIQKLKEQKNLISLITAFLLETQYIEFHLQGFITELDIVKNTEPQFVKFSGKKRKKEVFEMTLGALKDEIHKYNADFLQELKIELDKLNKLRIQFAHHVLAYGTGIDDLIKNSKAGLEANEKILVSLNFAFKYLDEYSWFGKMMANKKVNPSK